MGSPGLDADAVRAEFPFFAAHPGLAYLDSAATTQKPRAVLEAVERHLREEVANPGRGSYRVASSLTRRIEDVRTRVAAFLGTDDPSSTAFTSGATAALNAVAQGWGRANLRPGDEVLLSSADHASAVAPWHLLASERGLRLVEYRRTPSGDPDVADLAARVTPATKVVVVTHVHNVYGEIADLADIRRRVGPDMTICVDAAQSVGHTWVDVSALGADFVAFSGHKMFAPPGTGVLWASGRALEAMRPAVVGGGMRESSGLAALVESGTPNTAGIVGLGRAVEFVESLGVGAIGAHVSALSRVLIDQLGSMPQVELVPDGPFAASCQLGHGIVSFRVHGVASADVGFVLDDAGVCVRAGSHCLHEAGPAADTVRISLHAYTTEAEVERALEIVGRLRARHPVIR